MRADMCLRNDRDKKTAAAAAHLARMEDMREYVLQKIADGNMGIAGYLTVQFYCAEAKAFVAQAKGKPSTDPESQSLLLIHLAIARLGYSDWFNNEESRLIADRFNNSVIWSRDWFKAEFVAAKSATDKTAAADKYLERTRQLEQRVNDAFKARKIEQLDVEEMRYVRADVDLHVAEARTGSEAARLRSEAAEAKLQSAKIVAETRMASFLAGRSNFEAVYEWSTAWRDAAIDKAASKAQRITAAEDHLRRMRTVDSTVRALVAAGRASEWSGWATAYMVADAELFLMQTKKL